MIAACGVVNCQDAAKLVVPMLSAMQHRKIRELCLAVTDGEKITHLYGTGLVGNVFDPNKKVVLPEGHTAIAMGLDGGLICLEGVHDGNQFALMFGGKMKGSDRWRKKLQIPLKKEAAMVGVRMYSRHTPKNTDPHAALIRFLSRKFGVYSAVLLYQGNVTIMRDPCGFLPMTFSRFGDRFQTYAFATETCALDFVGANKRLWKNLERGEWVTIDEDGAAVRGCPESVDNYPSRLCSLSYIYGLRPDSEADGISPVAISEAAAKVLAKKLTGTEIDLVVPAPDSGVQVGSVLGDKLRKSSLSGGMLRDHYLSLVMSRTGRQKFSVVPNTMGGKKVLLVVTSILEGYTVTNLIRLCKRAGALEVHVAMVVNIVCGCPFNLAFPGKNRFLGGTLTLQEITSRIGAASVNCLSLKEYQGIFSKWDSDNFCFHCMGCSCGVSL